MRPPASNRCAVNENCTPVYIKSIFHGRQAFSRLIEFFCALSLSYYENIHFTLTPIKKVILKFHKDIHDSIFAMPFHEQQEIVWETDDPVFKLVKIPEAPMENLVQRILSYAGKLVAVKPKIL